LDASFPLSRIALLQVSHSGCCCLICLSVANHPFPTEVVYKRNKDKVVPHLGPTKRITAEGYVPPPFGPCGAGASGRVAYCGRPAAPARGFPSPIVLPQGGMLLLESVGLGPAYNVAPRAYLHKPRCFPWVPLLE
jgi:hypothetical protein